MQWLTLAGMLLGFGAIVYGNLLEGGTLAGLINVPAAIIVLGGTFAAVMIQTPMAVFKSTLIRTFWLFFPPRHSRETLLENLCEWASAARRTGFIGLENIAAVEHSLLARKGLNLLADGQTARAIRSSLELDMYKQEDAGMQAAHVYDSLGGYAPTIGIIGAVLGLMQALTKLENPDQIGAGIATAFVATVYGLVSANLVFLPLGQRIKHIVREEYLYNELTIEGLVAIAEGEHPLSLRYRYENLRRGE